MSKEEQDEILAGVRKRRCEARQRLVCHRIRAEEVSEKLRMVADALPEGREEDSQLMLDTPSVSAVSTLHGYIRGENAIIAKCDEQLARFARAVQGEN